MFPDIAGLRRNLFRKATGRHPKNLRAHPSSKTGALSVRGKSVNPISAIGILNYKQHACNYKRLQGGLSIAKARVFAFLLRGRRSRSARFAAGALASVQLFGCGVLPRLFFSNSRPQTGARRGSFCRRARVQTGVRCFHRVGCEKSGTAGCPPNMENGAGFGRLVGKTVGKVPAGHKSGGRPVRFCAWRFSLFRSAVRAFFAKRRAANPARPGRAHGAKRRKQIFLKPPRCGGALAPLGSPRCGGALAPLGSPPASLAFPPRAQKEIIL